MTVKRVGLISDLYDSPGGVGRYVRQLVTGMRECDDIELVLIGTADNPASELPDLVRVLRPPGPLGAERRKLFTLRRTLQSLDLDVIHEPYNFAPGWPSNAASVLTIHDLMPLKFPHRYGFRAAARAWANIARRAGMPTQIIADSSSTAEDIKTFFGEWAFERTSVIPLGVDQGRFRPLSGEERNNARNRFFGSHSAGTVLLYVGLVSTRKHVHLLTHVLKRLPPDVSLVIAGAHGPGCERILSAASKDPRILVVGKVSEAELPLYLGAADAFVFPSPYEGFGLPPLEAMACGTPVVVTRASSLPEVVGRGGVYFTPGRIQELEEAIRSLLDPEVRLQVACAALEQARKFDWCKTVDATASIYERAAGGDVE